MIIPKDNNILMYLQSLGQEIIAPCNGKGICGKCKVVIETRPTPNKTEENLLSAKEVNDGVRLACSRTTNSDTKIHNLFDVESYAITESYEDNFLKNPYITSILIDGKYHIERAGKTITIKDSPNTFGIAIDIGTTTVALILFNLYKKIPVETISFLNPQSKYGSDVISRIQYASKSASLKLLSNLIINKINQEIHHLLLKNDIDTKDLFEIVISGNTVMNHLLLNVDPTSIAQAPYRSSFLNTVYTNYKRVFGKDIECRVTVLGGLDSYVGGDLVSGIYSLDIHKSTKYNILVDLGTNGEMIVGNKDIIYGTSTAAGPAFEGVNIHAGIGAIDGAICEYVFNETPITIHNKKPIGICGSGIIDIVSELHKHKLVDDSGYMESPYPITSDISFFPKDIREVQLAKSAIRAGLEMILSEANLSVDDIGTLYLSGGFGKHVNIDNLYSIGIFPPKFKSKTKVVGNSSLAGAVKYLFSPFNNEIEEIRKNKSILNLGTSLKFQELFIKYIPFKK